MTEENTSFKPEILEPEAVRDQLLAIIKPMLAYDDFEATTASIRQKLEEFGDEFIFVGLEASSTAFPAEMDVESIKLRAGKILRLIHPDISGVDREVFQIIHPRVTGARDRSVLNAEAISVMSESPTGAVDKIKTGLLKFEASGINDLQLRVYIKMVESLEALAGETRQKMFFGKGLDMELEDLDDFVNADMHFDRLKRKLILLRARQYTTRLIGDSKVVQVKSRNSLGDRFSNWGKVGKIRKEALRQLKEWRSAFALDFNLDNSENREILQAFINLQDEIKDNFKQTLFLPSEKK